MLGSVTSRPPSVLCVDGGAADGLVGALRERADRDGLDFAIASDLDDACARLGGTDTVDCVVGAVGGADGRDVRKAVRRERPTVPVVLVATAGATAPASDVVADSATDYVDLARRVDETALGARVADAAERHRDRARREAERRRARTLLDISPDAILVSVDDEYVYANPAAVDLFEADDADDLVGLRPIDVIPSRGRQTVANVIDAIQAGERVVDQTRRSIVTLEGNRVVVEVTGRGFVWGGERSVVATMRDVTERERLEEELRERNERLEEFASVVSHDLRTPLTTARGSLELAGEAVSNEHLDWATRSLDRADRIVEDLYSLAREGREIGPTVPVDVATAVEAAWDVVGGETAGAELVLGEGDLGTVVADENRFRQLLENLLGNAVEHAGPDVRVRVAATERGFAVEDDGPGVPAEVRDRAFERGVTTREAGTGLGLALVATVADAHDWDVRLADASTGGTRVEVATDPPHGAEAGERSA